MLSVIIPVYNESSRINRLKKVIDYCEKHISDFEIIIVDDGSTDNTLEQINKMSEKIKIVHYDKNKGKGYAVRTGIKKSSRDNVLFMDIDLSTSLKEKNFADCANSLSVILTTSSSDNHA